MTRLRVRVIRAAARDPGGLVRGVLSYVRHRRRVHRSLSVLGLDDLLRRLDAVGNRGATDRVVLSASIELGDALDHAFARRARGRGSDPAERRACLRRALARYALFVEHGLAPTFVVGVAPDAVRSGSEAIGHAWVEVDGAIEPPERVVELVESLRWTARARASTGSRRASRSDDETTA